MTEKLLAELIELRPVIISTMLICVLFYVAVMFRLRKFSINDRTGILAATLVGLEGKSLVHMAVALIRIAFYSSILLVKYQPGRVVLTALVLLILVSFLLKPGLRLFFYELFGGGIQIAGLVLCTYLQKYLSEIKYIREIEIAYWLMTALLIIASIVVFVQEMSSVSGERKHFDETGDTE